MSDKVVSKIYAAWLRVIQTENSCKPTGAPCHVERCGCVAEQQMLIEEYRAAEKDGNDDGEKVTA